MPRPRRSRRCSAATLGAPYQQLLTATKAVKVAISLGALTIDATKKHASAPFQTTVTPEGFASWSWPGTLPLVRAGKTWQVSWTPALVHPQLVAGESFKITTSFGSRVRAQVLGAGDQVLVGIADVYAIGMTPGKMTDPTGEIATLAGLLKPQGITVEGLTAKYTAGLAHPAQKIPIISLRELDFAPIEPKLRPLPGVPYTRVSASIAESPTFAHALLGRVSAVTADELKTLGAGYTATSQVGQSGVEKAYESRLAGTPDASVVLVGADGKTVGDPLTTFPGVAGQPVTLTIDPKVQAAAETALGTVDSPVGDVTSLVAIKPSTGEVLAVANRPSASSFDAGLEGRLPPGSTFKVVSSDGLLSAGVTPDSPVPCVPSINVGGEVFHNFQGESVAGTVPFSQDFAISCNTAFISLSSKLSGGRLETAASDFGLGGSWQIGLNVNHGAVPAPKDAAELASATIGQGQLAMSPLDMAMVAATVADGTWRAPQLVTKPAPTSPAAHPQAAARRGGDVAAVVDAWRGDVRDRRHRVQELPRRAGVRQDRHGGDCRQDQDRCLVHRLPRRSGVRGGRTERWYRRRRCGTRWRPSSSPPWADRSAERLCRFRGPTGGWMPKASPILLPGAALDAGKGDLVGLDAFGKTAQGEHGRQVEGGVAAARAVDSWSSSPLCQFELTEGRSQV